MDRWTDGRTHKQRAFYNLPTMDVVRFDLGPLLQGPMRIDKVKSADNLLIIGPTGVQCKTNL